MAIIEEIDSDGEYQDTRSQTRNRNRSNGGKPQNGNRRRRDTPPIDFTIFKRKDPSTIKVSQARKSLKKIKTMATTMDNFSFNPLPIPIGLDSIIGLIPWLGDPITLLMALFQVWLAFTGLGLPYSIVGKMIVYVIIDFFIGIIPFIGDLVDTMFQANIMNHKLAEEWFESNINLYQVG